LTASSPGGPLQEAQEGKEKKEGHIYIADEVNVKIKLVKMVKPIYPEDAREQGITGVVRLDITIDEAGKVVDAVVAESPHESLAKAATDAVLQWEYEPPTKDGKPVSVKATVTVKFQLS